MLVEKDGVTRRYFIKSGIAAMGAATLPFSNMTAQNNKAKYTRYNVMSPGGRKALASYANGVRAMLKLPADHPQNWFRNAFIHLMDCPTVTGGFMSGIAGTWVISSKPSET